MLLSGSQTYILTALFKGPYLFLAPSPCPLRLNKSSRQPQLLAYVPKAGMNTTSALCHLWLPWPLYD